VEVLWSLKVMREGQHILLFFFVFSGASVF
jgi:hypothetical protein